MDRRGKVHAKSGQNFCGKCRRERPIEVRLVEFPYTPWKDRNPQEKAKLAAANRKSRLKREYGLTVEQYTEMRVQQGGRCAVCHRESDRLVVDHDHTTSKVRALLCNNCNIAIGHAHDDPARLEALKQYLIRFQESSS